MPANLLPKNIEQLPNEHWMKCLGLAPKVPKEEALAYCLNLISYDSLLQILSCGHNELLTISLM